MHLKGRQKSENPGVPVLFGGHNLPPLVEIGLPDLPKSGGTPGTHRDDRPALMHASAKFFYETTSILKIYWFMLNWYLITI